MIDLNFLKDKFAQYDIEVSEQEALKFDIYADILVETNKVMNLTAITEPSDIVIKHFLDSVILTKVIKEKRCASLADIGTGAGFPGVPVKIIMPELRLALIDGLNKRVNFLNEVCNKLSLDVTCIHARAEDLGRNPEYRAQYDMVTARAVAKMSELCEYCLPYTKMGGYFVALKGADVEDELKQSHNALNKLGGTLERVDSFSLPDGSRRSIIIIRKIKNTPDEYPRPHAKMVKKPL